MKMTSADVERHKDIFLRTAPAGQTIYSVARRSRQGDVTGARYFVATGVGVIDDVTPHVAVLTGCSLDNVTGFMRTRSVADAVELLGIRLFDSPKVYTHKKLM